MAAHNCRVTYTIDDDGIHLQCEDCELDTFDLVIGYEPTADQIYAAQDDHQERMRDHGEG